MSRILITNAVPEKPENIPTDVRLITPNRSIGDALKSPCERIQSHAKKLLRKNGFGLASPMIAADVLKGAIAREVPGIDAGAFSRRINDTLKAILRSGVDIDLLERHAPNRVKPVARIARNYVAALRRMNLIDSEASLIEATKLDNIRKEKILVYGYFRGRQAKARPEEIEFIDRIAADGSVFYLPCGPEAIFEENNKWRDILVSRGWEVSEEADRGTASIGAQLARAFARGRAEKVQDVGVDAFVYPSIEAEVRGTLARVKAVVTAGTPIEKVAVVCRDIGLYSKLLVDVAREYRMPVEIDCQVPIGSTVFGEFVSLIFEAAEAESAEPKGGVELPRSKERRGFQFEPTARLLRHPLGPVIEDELWSEVKREHPTNATRWAELVGKSGRLKAGGKRSLSSWMDWLRGVAHEWRVRYNAARDAAEIAAYNSFFESLEQVARRAGDEPCSFERFTVEVFEILADVKTLFHPESGGVRVIEPNAVVGCEFDQVFVMGMAEGVLPAPSSDDPVIDFYERERLREFGVEFQDAFEVPRWETLTFYFTLLAAREKVHFSFPQFIDGKEQIKSSCFERMNVELRAADDVYISSAQEHRRAFLLHEAGVDDEVFDHARRQYSVEQRRYSELPRDEYDGVIDIAVDPTNWTWSVSKLTSFGRCRFQWFADNVLWLGSPAEAELELASNTRGSLYHKTMELAVKQAIAEPNIREAVLARLDEAFAEAEKSDGIDITKIINWELRRDEHLELLRKFVADECFVGEGVSVEAVEAEFDLTWKGLRLRGKIDRIDRTTDGLAAVDYKTGSAGNFAKDETGRLKLDVQMPVYSKAALPDLFKSETQFAAGSYLSFKDRKASKERDADLEAFIERLKADFARGNFAVEPDVDGKACEFCAYESVCRQGARLWRKPAE
jgi:hypothetical protein